MLLHQNTHFHTGGKYREILKEEAFCVFSKAPLKAVRNLGQARLRSWLSQSSERQVTPATEVKLG